MINIVRLDPEVYHWNGTFTTEYFPGCGTFTNENARPLKEDLNHNFSYIFNEIQSLKQMVDRLESENAAIKTENREMKQRLDEVLNQTTENITSLNNNYNTFLEKEEVTNQEIRTIKDSINNINSIQHINTENYHRLLNFTEEMKTEVPRLVLKVENITNHLLTNE
jgi:chromosome segregation ATPase